jgi:hypothetical protein
MYETFFQVICSKHCIYSPPSLLYLCFPSDRTMDLLYQPSFIAFNIVPFVPLLHSFPPFRVPPPPLCLLKPSRDSGRFNMERDNWDGLASVEVEICGGRRKTSRLWLVAEGTCSFSLTLANTQPKERIRPIRTWIQYHLPRSDVGIVYRTECHLQFGANFHAIALWSTKRNVKREYYTPLRQVPETCSQRSLLMEGSLCVCNSFRQI